MKETCVLKNKTNIQLASLLVLCVGCPMLPAFAQTQHPALAMKKVRATALYGFHETQGGQTRIDLTAFALQADWAVHRSNKGEACLVLNGTDFRSNKNTEYENRFVIGAGAEYHWFTPARELENGTFRWIYYGLGAGYTVNAVRDSGYGVAFIGLDMQKFSLEYRVSYYAEQQYWYGGIGITSRIF